MTEREPERSGWYRPECGHDISACEGGESGRSDLKYEGDEDDIAADLGPEA